MSLHDNVRQQLLGQLRTPRADGVTQLNEALRLLAKWRSALIQNTLLQQHGTVVMQGPLRGLDFQPQLAEGCQSPSCWDATSKRCSLTSKRRSRAGAVRHQGRPARTARSAAAPALAGMDLIVESHECLQPGITQMLVDRFAATHEITLVNDDGQRQLQGAPPWFCNLAHLDQLLATWEWRSGPTPWLVMRTHAAG